VRLAPLLAAVVLFVFAGIADYGWVRSVNGYSTVAHEGGFVCFGLAFFAVAFWPSRRR